MAAHIGQPTPSRRFIKIYLSTWGLLAAGALAYLAVLAFPPQAAAPPPQASVDPVKVGGESKVMAEVRSIRGSLSEIRKDVTQLQDAVGERAAAGKVVETRLSVLEERVSTIDGTQPAAATSGGKAPDKTARKAGDQASAADGRGHDDSAATPVAGPPAIAIETGSISKDEIVFGAPVVKRAGQPELAVQLATAPSLQALRQSWGQLAERHPPLAALEPRVVAPHSAGGLYRLLAGPIPGKAEAERICSELHIGSKACFATAYTGTPL
jgi:hypothetical protein